ncbi:MAG: S8 family serine peptidase [Rhodocyclales bacterium]|nr:S8 family serine peptidase [Rhodocyclales bacterium]
MKTLKKTTLALLLTAAFAATGAVAAVIDPELAAQLATMAPDDEVGVIVQLRERPNLAQHRKLERKQRLRRMVREMRDNAERHLPRLETEVQALGGRKHKRLWAINGMAVKLPAARVARLARMPSIASIRYDTPMQAPDVGSGTAAPAEWNLTAVEAPDLWALGHRGNGVVVASMDTGVDGMHPDLAAKFRGGGNSWFDPHGEHATPYDAHGHGTQTMGIMAGGSVGGTAIGMVPDAQWIAFKQYDDAGQSSFSRIHEGFQWLLDPDGNPDTDDAPQVVNASWGFAGLANQCITEFNDDIALLKTAGIAVVFSAGNDGPGTATSISPGNNTQAYSVGAIDSSNTVAYFSSRGPSACDGSVFPTLTAPGVNIYTSDLSFGGLPLYAYVDGTSYAAPHAAGAMALLAGAFPNATVAELETALRDSSLDLGVPGADNAYGAGSLRVRAAYELLASASGNTAPQITSVPPTGATEGNLYLYDVNATDAEGDALSYALTQGPAGMGIDAATGLISWLPGAAQAGMQAVTVEVTDAPGLATSQSFTINVASANAAPAAGNDGYQMMQGGSLSINAPGVLGNDSDANGDALTAVLETAPASGTLTLNANGSFVYTPVSTYSGTLSFSYRARDAAGAMSAPATVSIAVQANRAPTAVDDDFAAPRRTTYSYAARILPVLQNDSDPDTVLDATNTINPATLVIVAKPNKGGAASAIRSGANIGTISYKPARGFVGTETITYRVKDTRGKLSNTATVSITVN